jgi:endonuclease/exonuclease/phosphatase family metal-dependent hydrolase
MLWYPLPGARRDQVKVVTWNLGYWQFRAKHDDAWTYLRTTIRPDIAFLQEVRPPKLMPREALVFKQVDRGWGTAIYSRNLPLDEIPLCSEYPGRVAGASLSLENGSRLHLASIHAYSDTPAIPRLANVMEEIMEIFSGRAAIVGGDLNSARLAETVWPGFGHGPFWERMERSSLVDCCQRVNMKELQTFFRANSKHPFQDDHLFVSRNLASGLKSCDVINTDVTRRVSDHIPLFIELDG